MRRLLPLLMLMLTMHPAGANELTLEFAQEGDPGQPRALIVIHNAFESRADLKPFFAAWATGSWGRDQYCSVYSYEYDGSGLQNLVSTEKLGQDLYARIASGDFEVPKRDRINPAARSSPTDARQPSPSLDASNLELMLAGHGYGGLIARRVCLLAKQDHKKVGRVGYIGTPLDGLSTVELVLSFATPKRAKLLGLSRALDGPAIETLSPAWWGLTDLFEETLEWSTVFAPAYAEVKMMAAHGAIPMAPHATDNVLYGRYRHMTYGNTQASDGFVQQPLAWGKKTGPIAWTNETTLKDTSQAQLTEKSADFILKQVLERATISGYLARREGIEAMVKGKIGGPPLFQYWDEREGEGTQPGWKDAYASRKGLYEMMWGFTP